MKFMKHIIFLSLLFSVVLFTACETDNDDPAGRRSVGIVGTIADVNPAIFIDGELEESFTSFVLDIPENTSFDEAYVVASYNGVSQRVRIKDVDAFPAEITITTQEAADVLGITLDKISSKEDDFFVFELVTVSNGVVSRSNAAVTIRVVCPFDPAMTIGGYTAVSSDWGANGGITIEADEEDPYTLYVYGLAELDGLTGDGGPLVMKINPLSFDVTADKKVLASSAFSGYTDIAYAGNGVFNSCNGAYEMLFAISVAQGNFGSFAFTFSRN
jgi:hypothetical protein